MVNLKDIAARAGVSVSTVSRALRNIGYVKNDTSELILKYAEEMGYVPNNYAQQLKTNSGRNIGIIVSDISNSYYVSILPALQKRLSDNDCNLILTLHDGSIEEEARCFYSLIASGVSCIFFTPVTSKNKKAIDIAQKNGVRVVQLFRKVYPDLDSVINDDEEACKSAAEYLITVGCKRLLLIDVNYQHLKFKDVSPCRSAGFLEAIASSEVSHHIIHCDLGVDNSDKIRKAIDEFEPDGVICGVAKSGRSVIDYIQKTNAHDKIKLITYDDNTWFSLLNISAIHQDTDSLSNAICDIVEQDNPEPVSIVNPSTLQIRSSC